MLPKVLGVFGKAATYSCIGCLVLEFVIICADPRFEETGKVYLFILFLWLFILNVLQPNILGDKNIQEEYGTQNL